MNALIEQAKKAKEKLVDQTEDNGGNFEYTPPEAGPCLMRLVSYVEIGEQEQPPFQGKEKAPIPECIMEFQLYGKKHRKEIEVEEDGEKVTKVTYPIIRIGRSSSAKPGKAVKNGLAMPGGSRSHHYKLLKAMDYGRGNTHMAFMLGEAFIGTVVHNDNGKEGKDKFVYANLRDDSGWKIGAPLNPTDGEPIEAPEATVPLRMLLWNAPSKEQWDSIHIEGTYTKKGGEGKEDVEVSKNWLQEQALGAVNFKGSALEAMLAAEGGDLPDMTADLDEVIEDSPQESEKEPEPSEDTSEDDKAPSGEAGAASDDPLADLGL